MSVNWGSLAEYDRATLLAEYQDCSRSQEAGPAILVPIIATILTAAYLIGGYKLTWRLCRWFR